MKTIGTDPISPTTEIGNNGEVSQGFGLTKREHMSIEFTKALLSNPNVGTILHNDDFMMHEVAAWGISQADELIRLLNQDENE